MLWKPTMTNPTPQRSLGSRVKMMLGHTWLMLIALGCIAIGIGAIVYRVSTEPLWLQIAVGPEGSEDVKIVQALASQLGRDSASLRLKVNVTGGTEESAAAIE